MNHQMMRLVVTSGTGRRAQPLRAYAAAGKTGTTQSYRDAWFCGFTGNYVAAVWFGNVFIAGRDSGGQPLTGNCTYAVSGLTPPARFWTLVALGKDAQTLKPATGIPGAINALNVLRAEDGRFSITVSALAATGNWLAIENEGPFRLRLTLIDTPVSSSSGISALEMPVITRTDCRHA